MLSADETNRFVFANKIQFSQACSSELLRISAKCILRPLHPHVVAIIFLGRHVWLIETFLLHMFSNLIYLNRAFLDLAKVRKILWIRENNFKKYYVHKIVKVCS